MCLGRIHGQRHGWIDKGIARPHAGHVVLEARRTTEAAIAVDASHVVVARCQPAWFAVRKLHPHQAVSLEVFEDRINFQALVDHGRIGDRSIGQCGHVAPLTSVDEDLAMTSPNARPPGYGALRGRW